MADNNDIFYRPDLVPEREYWSDAAFEKASQKTDTVLNSTIDDKPTFAQDRTEKIYQLISDMQSLKELLEDGPKDIKHIAQIIDILRQRLIVMFPAGWPEELEEKNVLEAPKPNISLIDFGFAPEFILAKDEIETTGINVQVEEPSSLKEITIRNYARDTLDLQEFYVTSMQKVLQNYYNQMFMISAESGTGDYRLLENLIDCSSSTVPASDQYLKDTLARSQAIRAQKAKFLQKTHNADQTMVAMRRWHAAQKERERLYSQSYGDSSTLLGHEANETLRKARKNADTSYSQSLYDMYKYLNSSAETVDDLLTMSVDEAKAKGKMLQDGAQLMPTESVTHSDIILPDPSDTKANVEATDFGAAESIKNGGSAAGSNVGNNNTESGTVGPAGAGAASSAIIEKALQWAVMIANDADGIQHGYSQADRLGPVNYDCTSFVSISLQQGGLSIPVLGGPSFDDDIQQYGFVSIPFPGKENLKRGDILSSSSHVAWYLGNDQVVHASQSGKPLPDQILVSDFYGSWNNILRYNGN